MKKIIIPLLFFLVVSCNVFSQINFSLKAGSGINNSVSYLKDISDSKSLKLVQINTNPAFSYSAGGEIGYYMNKNKVSVAVLYASKSFIFYDDLVNKAFNVKNRFINIPIYIKHLWFNKFGSNIGIENNIFINNSFEQNEYKKAYNFGIVAGIYYNISKKAEITLNYKREISPYESIHLFDNMQNSYNYGAMLSLSYKIFEK